MPAPQAPQNNPVFNTLFKNPAPAQTPNQVLTKGSLILFRYSFWMHDPSPLVIVSSYNYADRINGVNLHYLTYPVISSILSASCSGRIFSYANYKGNSYISGAFRTYKWNGISQIKKLDCNALLKIISGVRSIDPSQVKAIQQSVEDQLRKQTNPTLDNQEDQNNGIVPTVQTVGQAQAAQAQQANNTQTTPNEDLNGR